MNSINLKKHPKEKKMRKLLTIVALLLTITSCRQSSEAILIEAENFSDKGGWVVDQQFMDLMGSPYLMAHGMGVKVDDASTTFQLPCSGTYTVFVRTYNWTSPWSEKRGAGEFKISISGSELPNSLGATGVEWEWQRAGEVELNSGENSIVLTDLTGFNGRCDAIYLTQDGVAPKEGFSRNDLLGISEPRNAGEFDFVVVGGGVAGMCAAMAAAREGLKVALINDRPVLGGNNSAEIRVHLGGRVNVGEYENLGNMLREFGHSKFGNAQPAENYEDDKKQEFIESEKNITLFPSTRAIGVQTKDNRITEVITKHIESGEELSFLAPIFSDCTGDGTIGYLAGAEFRMGREARSEFNEPTAPEEADKMTMGASVQWYSVGRDVATAFPEFDYELGFNEQTSQKVTMGEWTWETGMNLNQIEDFERIRDYGLAVIYSNWSFLKNHYSKKENYANRELQWVAYVSGKRESRRLMGDLILTEVDLIENRTYQDATAATSWTIDLHYPDPENSKDFPDAEFKSICVHQPIHLYGVPYRCLYSRNVENLFMAGRNISVTHTALGTTRVMRTTAMLGEVVGMAAAICSEHKSLPRSVYTDYLGELKDMMREGAGSSDAPDNQNFNLGDTLGYVEE